MPNMQTSAITTTAKALGADVATSLYGATGAGLKIGIISDSFNATGGAAADMAAGFLPKVTVLADKAGSDEGRVMIEDANSVAPGAQYYFAAPIAPGPAGLAAAITALQNAGCSIIVDDLTVSGESFYQTGSAADLAIAKAVAAGVNYFTSAGNNGNDCYERGFTPISTTIAGVGTVTANDFGGGNTKLSLMLPANGSSDIVFQFAQPFASYGDGSTSPTNSLAIYLLDSSGKVVASSTTNTIGGDPEQFIIYNNQTANTQFSLVVVQNGSTVSAGELFKVIMNNRLGIIDNPKAGIGSGSLIGHEQLPGINVLGSVEYANTPAFGVSPSQIEAGSSIGPGRILYDAQGHLLAKPIVVNEPQFQAPDGSSFPAAGTNDAFAPFFGTSAAAPAAGAVTALVLQANGKLTTAQVTALLAETLIPVKVNAPASGAGLIQARAAVEIATAYAGDR